MHLWRIVTGAIEGFGIILSHKPGSAAATEIKTFFAAEVLPETRIFEYFPDSAIPDKITGAHRTFRIDFDVDQEH